MSKGIKKVLIITGSVIAAIILIMVAIPFLFKDKIKVAVIEMAKENLNAEVVVGDFGLNLFSNFPNATLSLKDTYIAGVEKFEGDTLLKTKNASVTIDLFSLFGENYKINKIELNDTKIYAKILEDGTPNWDIVKSDGTEVAVVEEASPFNLNLNKIIIKNSSVTYEDLESNIKAVLANWNGEISGDFSASETTLKTKSIIDEITVAMDGIPYLSKVKATVNAELNANFDQMKFTFTNSQCFLNELETSIDGWFAFVDEDAYDFDLKLKAPGATFKQVLSLVPAMYTQDFKNVKTAGDVALSAYIVGEWKGEVYPAFNLNLTVDNAMFQYPTLPKSVDNINLTLQVNGKGGSLDNVMVLADKFGFTIGGNPFKGSFRMTPAGNDRSIEFKAEGKVNLAIIPEVYPMEAGTNMKGNIDADVRIATSMSAIEKEQYDKVSAEGHIKVANLEYKSAAMPDILVNTASLEFSPRYVNLSNLDLKIGESDLKASGKLENFIAYALKDQTLKGTLDIRSKTLNLDELMGEDVAEEEAASEEPMESIIIPKNLDLTMNAAFTHMIFNKINITNVSGGITAKDGILSLNNLAASALGGLANINGSYNTSNPEDPKVDFDMALTRVSFAETFKHIETVQKFAPIFENVLGTFSMNLKLGTKLKSNFSETLAGLTASGLLATSDVKLEGNKALSALGSALKTDKLDNLSTKNLNLPFTIEDGALKTKPFNVNFGDGGEMMLEGVTRLDQTIDYKGTVKLPASLDNKYVSKVPITIGGTFNNPKIGIDAKGMISSVVGGLIGGKDGEGADLSVKMSEEKAKQIAKIREEADNAALKIVDTAKKIAKEGETKAGSNAIAKLAAKKLGEAGVKKAEEEAQKLRDKAEEQIKKLEGETEAVETKEVTETTE